MALMLNALISPLRSGMLLHDRPAVAGTAMTVIDDVNAIFVVIAIIERWVFVAGLGRLGWMHTSQLFTRVTRVSNEAHAA